MSLHESGRMQKQGQKPHAYACGFFLPNQRGYAIIVKDLQTGENT